MDKFFNFLGLAKRSRNILEGYSKCNEGKRKQKIFLFIISKDASDSSKRKFINYCEINKIPYIHDFLKEDLGKALGREELKIIALTDKNMADKLLTLYKEENV